MGDGEMDAAAEFWVAWSDKKDAAFATESLRSLFELYFILFKNDIFDAFKSYHFLSVDPVPVPA
jgi:hypothetical protein